MHLCGKYRKRRKRKQKAFHYLFFTSLFLSVWAFFGRYFMVCFQIFSFFRIFPRKYDRRFFSFPRNQMTADCFEHGRLKKKIHFVWSKMLIKLSTLSGKLGNQQIFMRVTLCVSVQGHSAFWQESGHVEPFSTQIKRGCQKMAKNIKWNNTWEFNSTKTFDRNKQRNCTWIEQKSCYRFFGFSMHKPTARVCVNVCMCVCGRLIYILFVWV